MKRLTALIVLVVAGFGPCNLFADDRHQQSILLEQSTIGTVNELFNAVSAKDQKTINRLMLSEDEIARKATSGKVLLEGQVSVEPASSGSTSLAAESAGSEDSQRYVGWLSKIFSGLQQPESYAFEDDPYFHELVLNFECKTKKDQMCVKHLYFFLSDARGLVVDSYMVFTNTPEWDELWESSYKRGLVFRPAAQGQFALPLGQSRSK